MGTPKIPMIPNKIHIIKKLYYKYDSGFDYSHGIDFNNHGWFWFMVVDEDGQFFEHILNMAGSRLADGRGCSLNTKIKELIEIAEHYGITNYYEKYNNITTSGK